MTLRKKRVLILQLLLFFIATTLIYFTYYYENKKIEEVKLDKLKNKDNIKNDDTDENLSKFSNVEYKGLDLNGNRYILKSEFAEFSKTSPEIIFMRNVNANFYFKDNTTLIVKSKNGIYNNKSNDIKFDGNVVSKYLDSRIESRNLDFFNTKNLLEVYGNVRGDSDRGKIFADKLSFDLSEKTLDITMIEDKTIGVKVYK